jgi:hypothetical protein
LVIIIEDEASPVYLKSGPPNWGSDQYYPDLAYLRAMEHELGGRIDMVFIRPRFTDKPANWPLHQIKPYGEPFPVEIIRTPEYIMDRIRTTRPANRPLPPRSAHAHPVRSTPETRAVFADIYNNIIRKDGVVQYQCIGVFVDISGSMIRATVEDVLEEFYWNLHQTTPPGSYTGGGHSELGIEGDYVQYLEPLPSCVGGSLSLGKANGCIYESQSMTEQWLRECANASKTMFQHPGGCSNNCFCDQGVPELCVAMGDVTQTPVTITINCSFIIAGTDIYESDSAGGTTTAVTVECTETGVTHEQFVAEVVEALAVWKAALEHITPWVTVNFVNLGDETTTDIPSVQSYSTTYSLPQGNIGDFRFGMHNIDGANNTIGHGWPQADGDNQPVLGSIGSVAGDFHFDVSEKWRMDGTSVTGAASIKYVAVHELGHILGISAPRINEVPDYPSHLSDPDAIMYYEVSALTDFDTKFPTGVVGSAPDLAALKLIYCIS